MCNLCFLSQLLLHPRHVRVSPLPNSHPATESRPMRQHHRRHDHRHRCCSLHNRCFRQRRDDNTRECGGLHHGGHSYTPVTRAHHSHHFRHGDHHRPIGLCAPGGVLHERSYNFMRHVVWSDLCHQRQILPKQVRFPYCILQWYVLHVLRSWGIPRNTD